MPTSLVDCFSKLDDPQVAGRVHHALLNIMMLSVCAVASGAEGLEAIEDFGQDKLDWLRQYIPLANGVPSHDCISN